MAQLAEAGGLNPPEYGFESHWGHASTCFWPGEMPDMAVSWSSRP